MGDWRRDQVLTSTGVVVPVRATARRPLWAALPEGVRSLVEARAGAPVVSATSAGTGFTPGFASRLVLDDGSSVFVKAASSADDRRHGWALSDAYREEVRKVSHLPADIGAPRLRWHEDREIDGEQWVVAAFDFVDGQPPRRPWRDVELSLVLDKLAAVAPRLAPAPPALGLESLEEHLAGGAADRIAAVASREPDDEWLSTVSELCADALAGAIGGTSIVHMDLREDNVLIDVAGEVWFVDWNWPVVGAAWVDLVCILLSAAGDGHDADALLAAHPIGRGVDPHAVDSLLAVVWTFWAVAVDEPAPHGSPHLRDHQRWYLEASRGWLERRLAGR
jgi:aminoglycoside phosphotransferase (APT) family kinase protein